MQYFLLQLICIECKPGSPRAMYSSEVWDRVCSRLGSLDCFEILFIHSSPRSVTQGDGWMLVCRCWVIAGVSGAMNTHAVITVTHQSIHHPQIYPDHFSITVIICKVLKSVMKNQFFSASRPFLNILEKILNFVPSNHKKVIEINNNKIKKMIL